MLHYSDTPAEGETVTVKSVSSDERRAVFEMSSSSSKSRTAAESGKVSICHMFFKIKTPLDITRKLGPHSGEG